MKDWQKLLISLFIPQLAGVLGSIANFSSLDTWYIELNKPWFNPPSWIFAPVWTILFLLMGFALYLVWKQEIQRLVKKRAVVLFGIQMALNVVWSVLFFGLRMPLWAFIEILMLWGAIAATIISFYHIKRVSGWLLMPYIVWVSFAAVLNGFLWYLN